MSVFAAEMIESQEQDPMGLNFVSADLNGHTVMVMVDNVATHNFMKDSVSKRLGLTLEEPPNTIKAINSQMEKVVGKAKDVSVKLGDWSRVIGFTVVPLDDFDVVIGQNLLRVAKAVPMTWADSMVIFLGEDPVVVPM